MMDERGPIDVVVVSHETRPLLEGCLRSLNEASRLLRSVVVVDNASGDGSAEVVKTRLPEARLIRNEANLGFARGANQGLRRSTAPFVLLLNADVSFAPEAVAELLAFAESHDDAYLTVPRLRFPDGSPQASCRSFYSMGVVLFRRTPLGKLFPRHPILRRHLMTDMDPELPRMVDWAMGAAWLISRRALETVGFLDERYFLYLEDVDYCWRIRQAGGKVWYAPRSVMVHHYGRGSRGFRPWKAEVRAHALSSLLYADRWSGLVYQIRKALRRLTTPLAMGRDLLVMDLSFLLAHHLRIEGATRFARPFLAAAPWGEALTLAHFILPLSLLVTGAYERHEGSSAFAASSRGFLLALALMTVFLILAPAYRTGYTLSRGLALLWALFTLMGLLAGRWLWRAIRSRLQREGFGRRRVHVCGRGPVVTEIVASMIEKPEAGWELAAWVNPPRAWKALAPAGDGPLWKLLEEGRGDEVLVGDGVDGPEDLAALARCFLDGVRLRFVANRPPLPLPLQGELLLGHRSLVATGTAAHVPHALLREGFQRLATLLLLLLGFPRYLFTKLRSGQRTEPSTWTRRYRALPEVLKGNRDLVGATSEMFALLPTSLSEVSKPAVLGAWARQDLPKLPTERLRLQIDRLLSPSLGRLLGELLTALAFLLGPDTDETC